MRIMNLIRVAFRVPVALIWTEVLHAWIRFRQIFIRGRWRKHCGQDVIGPWGAGLAWIMGIRIHKLNERDWPMGDVIVSNHMGFLDVPVLLSVFPSVFIIKMEMRKVPHFGKALENQGHVFVERGSEASRRSAREGVRRVLANGDRIIVFPEGYQSPGAERRPFKPFCFFEAAGQKKRVEACVIDYLPDRKVLEWEREKPFLPQLVRLLGRKRIDVSLEFLPSEIVEDPEEAAQRYHDIIEGKLKGYDRERAKADA
jgi:1-acyl-sn-glycerol-3-phosphate acyltransferase